MSASPKSKRTPPSNKFEDYVLTYEVGQQAGLYPISSEKMRSITSPGASNDDVVLDMPFDFNFDNNFYRKIYINSCGYTILVHPDTPNPESVTDALLDDKESNWTIIDSVWSEANVILSTWWDSTRSVWQYTSDVSGMSTAAQYVQNLGLNVADVNLGIDPMPPGVDSTSGGVKCYEGTSSDDGRYFIVRWKSFTKSNTTSYNVVTYDQVLYESGKIEFRYAPCQFRQVDSTENAVVGIFAYGGSNYYPRYRDFGYMLKSDFHGGDSSIRVRKKYVNGGAVYNGLYTDTNGVNTTKYTNSLGTYAYWPGLNRTGAIFRFTPPKNRKKQNRSITTLRDSTSFTSWNSPLFNDQNSIFYPGSTVKVEYPTMLPANTKIENNTRDAVEIVELYRSGSITVDRVLRPGLFDDVLSDSIVDGRKRK